jgi:hypothetical protein
MMVMALFRNLDDVDFLLVLSNLISISAFKLGLSGAPESFLVRLLLFLISVFRV